MTGNITFSIMTPVYKVEAYLDDCVRSVLAQSYENFELILVDDGSPDRCGEMCDGWEKRDSRIKAFHKPNGGLLAARSYALERIGGDYAVFLDSDDMLRPNTLELLYGSIQASGADCVIYGYDLLIGERYETGCLCDERICGRVIRDRREVCNILLNDGFYNSLCRKCVRVSCFDGRDYSAYADIRYREDLVRSLEILENAGSFLFLRDSLYVYRSNPNSMMNSAEQSSIQIDHRVDRLVDAALEKLAVFTAEDYDRLRNSRLDALAIELRALARGCPDRDSVTEQMTLLRDDSRTAEMTEIGYRKVPVIPGQEQSALKRLLFRLNIALFRHRQYRLFLFIDRLVYQLKG